MRPIAFLTAGCVLPGHPDQRIDSWEHDSELGPMTAACRARDIELRPVVWDDPFDLEAFEAFVVGTTWDYTDRPQAFLAALERIAARRPLWNPLPVIRWNIEKTYLRDLAERGASVVPTLWREAADEASIAASFDELGVDEVVVKPVVGASAWRQARVRRGEPLPPAEALPPAETMIQPFLPAAASEGEYSFIFFDGTFSHAALKVPAEGDYRVQSMYGGRTRVHQPTPDELAITAAVLDAVDGPLLYARVDLMRGLDGRLAVMELELIEPYLYPEEGPGMGEAFADALVRLLDARD